MEIRRWADEGRSLVEFPDISQDELVIRLKAVLAQNESKMAGLTNRYRRKHPQFLELADAIATDRENIRREAERVSSSIIQQAQFEKSR